MDYYFMKSPRNHVVLIQPDNWIDNVPEGWKALFQETCDKIAAVLNKYPKMKITFLDVHTRFGVLSIQAQYKKAPREAVQECEKILRAAKSESHKTCICCGAPATLLSCWSWATGYCEKCAIETNDAANARHKTNFPMKAVFKKYV